MCAAQRDEDTKKSHECWMVCMYSVRQCEWCAFANGKNLCTLAVTNDFRSRVTFSLWTRVLRVLCISHIKKIKVRWLFSPATCECVTKQKRIRFLCDSFFRFRISLFSTNIQIARGLHPWNGTRGKLDSRFLLMAQIVPFCVYLVWFHNSFFFFGMKNVVTFSFFFQGF